MRATGAALVIAALVVTAVTPSLAQDELPAAIAAYRSELIAPGVWRVADDGMGNLLSGRLAEVRAGPDGAVWVLGGDGPFRLGAAAAWPDASRVDRLLAADDDGRAWLRYEAFDRQGFGSWDGAAWVDVSGPRRVSALERDPALAPGVIRDFDLAPDGAVWVVAGEQDGPRWERFTIERLDDDGWTTWAIGDGLPALLCGKNCGDRSRVLVMDDGTVWVSVDQGGLLRFDGAEWHAVRPLGGDIDLPIEAVVGDPAGTIWADMRVDDGVVRRMYDGTGWQALDHAQDDGALVGGPFTGPLARAVAPDGTLWLAGRDADGRWALLAIDDEGRHLVPDIGSCPDDEQGDDRGCMDVTSLHVAPDGLVWVTMRAPRGVSGGLGGALVIVDPAAALDAET